MLSIFHVNNKFMINIVHININKKFNMYTSDWYIEQHLRKGNIPYELKAICIVAFMIPNIHIFLSPVIPPQSGSVT